VIWLDEAKREPVVTYLNTEAKAYLPALEQATAVIEGFESPFPGGGGAGAAFGAEGEVEIFEFGFQQASLYFPLQFVGEFALGCDRFEYRFFAIFEFRQIVISFGNIPQLGFVEGTRPLFPVAGDKRDGCPLREQFQGIFDLMGFEGQFLSQDVRNVEHGRSVRFESMRSRILYLF